MPEHQMRASIIMALCTPSVQLHKELTDDQALLIVRNADKLARAMLALGVSFNEAKPETH